MCDLFYIKAHPKHNIVFQEPLYICKIALTLGNILNDIFSLIYTEEQAWELFSTASKYLAFGFYLAFT